ncbi:hypothetical protein C8255_04990 [filamentous cyanobacterium CCP3]|nr:hypothetical protein C8255_04990 [filamentous cyanobacterium CCP3]
MDNGSKSKAWNANRTSFERNLAIVIGIDQYQHDSIANLSTAVSDASEIAALLKHYDYTPYHLCDRKATLQNLKTLFQDVLPNQLKPGEGDRLLVYFAGHGLPRSNDSGPEGYLVPHDADPTQPDSFLAMGELYQALAQLECHHLLVILDCCFAGTFQWAGSRKAVPVLETIQREHYYHFIRHPAWQVLTSSAHDQEALDVARLKENNRQSVAGLNQPHSPFALALLEGLKPGENAQPSKADLYPDGVITAHELFVYLQTRVKQLSGDEQAPGIYPMRRDFDKGEFIFTSPNFSPQSLAKALALSADNNPYRGLNSFDERHAKSFFGRQALIDELADRLAQPDQALTVVLGVSGSGKSSLVKAGLLPRLRQQEPQTGAGQPQTWRILDPMRPGEFPLGALAQALLPLLSADPLSRDDLETVSRQLQQDPQYLSRAIAAWSQQQPGARLVMVIDQFEEVLTTGRGVGDTSPMEHHTAAQPAIAEATHGQRFLEALGIAIADHPQTLRLVLTLRSDFEPRFLRSPLEPHWQTARFPVRAMTSDELRQAIENPALKQAIYFEELKDAAGNPTGNLVSQLVDEVGQMPGALPLLSFVLSELYLRLYQRWQRDRSTDRTLRFADYYALGGVTGALTYRANEEYNALDASQQKTLRRVMLRMIAIGEGGIARRQVPQSELVYADPAENERVQTVLERYSTARLIVEGSNSQGEPYVEPAHDALVQGWDRLLVWKNEEEENTLLQRRLTPAATEWKTVQSKAQPSRSPIQVDILINGLDSRLYRVENLLQQSVARVLRLGMRSQQQPRSADQPTQFLWSSNPYLDVLNEKLRSNWHWLNRVETEFVQQSVLQKRRNLSWRWRITLGVILGLSGLTIAALIGQRNAQIGQIQASIESADANFRGGQSFEALLDGLSAANTLERPLLQVWPPNPQLKKQLHGTLQKATFSVRESNRLTSQTQGTTRSRLSPDGQLVAKADALGNLSLWDWNGRQQEPAPWPTEQTSVMNVAFSPDGKTIGTAGSDSSVRLWNLQGQATGPERLSGHSDMVKGISFSADGQWIATSGVDTTVRLWTAQGEPVWPTPTDRATEIKGKGHCKDVWSVVFSPDSKTLASASDDGTWRLWDLTGRQLAIVSISADGQGQVSTGSDPCQDLFADSLNELHTIRFSPDGNRVATAGRNGMIYLWSVQEERLLATLQGHRGRIWQVEFSDDGKQLASASADGTVRLWPLDLLSEQPPEKPGALETNLILQGHRGPVRHVNFSPDGQHLISSGDDGTVRFWTLRGQPLEPLDATPSTGLNASSNNAQQAITINQQNGIFYLTSEQGQPIATFDSNSAVEQRWNALTLSRDRQQLAGASADGVYLWNIENGRITQVSSSPFRQHVGPVLDVAFSNDGRYLVSSGEDGTIRIRDLNNASDSQRNLLPVYDAQVTSIDFSPNGRFLVSGDDRGNVQLWDWQNRREFADWQAHANSGIETVEFSQDSTSLITTAENGSREEWPLENFDQLHARGCQLVGNYLNSRQPRQSLNSSQPLLGQTISQWLKGLNLLAIASPFSDADSSAYDRDRSVCENR